MSRKVIFRCDAGHAPEIGTGHIARSKTLANNLVEKGFLRKSDIVFYTRNDSDYNLGEKYLAKSGYEYQVFANNKLEANSISELNILKNSNGTKNEAEGYLYMAENYLLQKTISVMVHKDAIPKKIRDKCNGF